MSENIAAAAMAEMAREVDRLQHERDLTCTAERLRDENETLRWRLAWAAADLLRLLDAGRIEPLTADSPYLATLREVVAESRGFDARGGHHD
jgi:hypothetical protein